MTATIPAGPWLRRLGGCAIVLPAACGSPARIASPLDPTSCSLRWMICMTWLFNSPAVVYDAN